MPKNLSIITSSYRWEKYLSAFFKSITEQTIFQDIEVVFVANDPTDKEKEIIHEFQRKFPENIVYIEVPREPLSISMNRAILASHGEYIFNWDIDDLRTPDSIEIQHKTLSSNKDIMLTYGDFIITKEFWSIEWPLVKSPEFHRSDFITGMYCGPFRAWKKVIHEKIGYFDEQLRSGADFDLMVRVAITYKMKKTQGLLGYYLNANTWLSTGGQRSFFSLQSKELRVISMRYNIHNKIDFFVPTKWYMIDTLVYQGNPITLTSLGFDAVKNLKFSEYIFSSWFTSKYGVLRIIKYIYLTLKRK